MNPAFRAAYTLDAHPEQAMGLEIIRFSDPDATETAPALVSIVRPAESQPWYGEFFGMRTGLTRLAPTTNPHVLFAVASGIGYLVPVDEPDSYTVVSLKPIIEIQVAEQEGLLICVSLTNIALIDAARVRWTTHRLAHDGFAEVRLTQSAVIARYYDPAQSGYVTAVVDLRDGSVLSEVLDDW